MRVLSLIACALFVIGCSSNVEEENVSSEAIKQAESKFETSASKEVSGQSQAASQAEADK